MWRQLHHFHQVAPKAFRAIIFLIIVEVLGLVICPMIIPDHWYLSWYLLGEARRKTRLFLEGKHLLIPDDATGWKNRPETRQGNWVIDVHGSRSTHDFDTQRNKSIRVLFLGSSMINGGTHIKNSETISAYLEDKEIESINFGTMLYSFDQVFLAYRSALYKYNANIIIIGLDLNQVEGLKNHYIPFRVSQEINMPFLKPRFKVSGESLELVPIRAEAMLSDLLKHDEGIKFLKENDGFYSVFATYKRMGLSPLSKLMRLVYLKFQGIKKYFVENTLGFQLLKLLMGAMVEEAERHDARVIFVILPNESVLYHSKRWGLLPDIYQRDVEAINSWGFEVIDVRNILRDSRNSPRDLFFEDQQHYTPVANHLIADVIRKRIQSDSISDQRVKECLTH